MFISENVYLVYAYAATITVMLACEIGAIVVLFRFGNDMAKNIKNGLSGSLDEYNTGYNATAKQNSTTLAWNNLQTDFECCGVTEFTDWGINPMLNATNSVPDSCCKVVTEDCGRGALNKVIPEEIRNWRIYTGGCYRKFFSLVGDNKPSIAVAVTVIMSIHAAVIIMSCYFGCHWKKTTYRKIS